MFKYIISYDGGQLRDSGDFEWGLFNSYGEAEEEANNAKEEYMNDWDIEGSEYDPDDFCIEIVERSLRMCSGISRNTMRPPLRRPATATRNGPPPS